MIYVSVFGGLGNQMFQFAAAYALAKTKNTKVGINLDRINAVNYDKNFTQREFELANVFRIERFEFVDSNSFNYIITNNRNLFNRIKRKLKQAVYYREKGLNYQESIHEVGSETYLEGYFQSYRYFDFCLSDIQKIFKFRNQFNSKTTELIKKIEHHNSVAVHVRRGDFVNVKKNLGTHGVCAPDYYKKAISCFDDCVFVVVSDDPVWAKENLSFGSDVYFVDWNKGADSWQDMLLISRCRHAIIANSSFSWWGAYLIDNPTKKVIAPLQWYADQRMQEQTDDLCPSSWIRIE